MVRFCAFLLVLLGIISNIDKASFKKLLTVRAKSLEFLKIMCYNNMDCVAVSGRIIIL
jgi:hypothetical protein